MEGKNVFMTALLVSLVLGQIQVEAKSCCPNTTARNIYNTCRLGGGSRPMCASLSECYIPIVQKCDPGWNHDILENTGENVVNEYCKLGCASSVCGAITSVQTSDASNIVNGAVRKCTKACYAFCTKASITAVGIA